MHLSDMLTECTIESVVDDVKAEEIVAEIVKLPLVDRVWPNCLGRAIRNSGLVDVNQFSAKLAKSIGKEVAGS